MARAFRERHLLLVALAGMSGKQGDTREACDLAEAAFTAALVSARQDERKACAEIARLEAERRSKVRAKLLDLRLKATSQETGREAAENIRAAIIERSEHRPEVKG